VQLSAELSVLMHSPGWFDFSDTASHVLDELSSTRLGISVAL
jgi:hypothetical protein